MYQHKPQLKEMPLPIGETDGYNLQDALSFSFSVKKRKMRAMSKISPRIMYEQPFSYSTILLFPDILAYRSQRLRKTEPGRGPTSIDRMKKSPPRSLR